MPGLRDKVALRAPTPYEKDIGSSIEYVKRICGAKRGFTGSVKRNLEVC